MENDLNVLMWQRPDSKAGRCARTMHLELSPQCLPLQSSWAHSKRKRFQCTNTERTF